MLRLIPKLHHLPSPGMEANVAQVQRFAPFHFDRAAQGIGEIRPAAFYEHLIPPDIAHGDDFAYFFDRDIPPDSPLARNLPAMNEALADWFHSNRQLSLHLGTGHVLLDDGTSSEALSRAASAVLVLSDETIAEQQLFERLGDVAGTLAELDERGLIVRMNGHVLGLVAFAKPQSSERLMRWRTRYANGPSQARSGA
jgi:hypothetical protein